MLLSIINNGKWKNLIKIFSFTLKIEKIDFETRWQLILVRNKIDKTNIIAGTNEVNH